MNIADMAEITESSIPFVARSGLQVLEARRGYAKCRMPIAGNGNHLHIMYAGALCTLAEFPFGILYANTHDMRSFLPIVKSMEVKFLRPAVTDVEVEMSMSEEWIQAVVANASTRGKADFTLETQLKATDGTVVATGHAVYQLRAGELRESRRDTPVVGVKG